MGIDDEVPICFFSSYEEWQKTTFLKDMKKQNLKAGARIVVGAYGPWCVRKECDDSPSLQCFTDREGKVLVVHTRYSGYHRKDSKCTESCAPMTAASASFILEAGEYDIRYGKKTYRLKIPSVLESPCFGTDEKE